MRNWFSIKAAKLRSIKATERANRRWAKDRAERDRLAAAAPKIEWKIAERIIRIIGEVQVQEVVIYEHDEWRDRKRKLRTLQLRPLTP